MIQYRDLLNDTICSPITPPGYSGVAVLRVSGPRAFSFTQELIPNKQSSFESHKSFVSTIRGDGGEKIDQVLLTPFSKGRSFTGDETVEISCHGNPLIVNAITKRYLEQGCRSAEKGEFSFRAYYNGNIDLVQAESIQSLVTTSVKQGSQTFLDQLQGQLSREFKEIEESLVTAMAHLEASIDFVEQDIEVGDYKQVVDFLMGAEEKVKKLLISYDTGKALQENLKILILGNTNAGKSSLFNRLIKADRAIVTDIEGTTRDLVSEQSFLGNSAVQFFDSAGLRVTTDPIEKMGIQKTMEKVLEAHVVVLVIDSINPGPLENFRSISPEKMQLVFTKIDLLPSTKELEALKKNVCEKLNLDLLKSQVSDVSSMTGEGVDTLLQNIENHHLFTHIKEHEGSVITQARHFNHLCQLKTHLDQAAQLMLSQESPDLISQELSLGLSEVHKLLGKDYDDEVLDKIFSQFCIGK